MPYGRLEEEAKEERRRNETDEEKEVITAYVFILCKEVTFVKIQKIYFVDTGGWERHSEKIKSWTVLTVHFRQGTA